MCNNFVIKSVLFVILSCIFSLSLSANDIIFRAMQDELQRSMSDLHIEDLKKPYFIEYSISISERNEISGTLGQINSIQSKLKRVQLDVSVRVGEYKFDQKNFFDLGLNFFGSSDEEEIYQGRYIPTELDYAILRRELWLATDAAYKAAAELLSRKESALKNKIRKDTLWDLSSAPKNNLIDTISFPEVDTDYATEIVRGASAVFLNFPDITSSKVEYYFLPKTIYYLNSEGTQYAKNEFMAGIEVAAYTQAKDGMPLMNYYVALNNFPSELPSKDSILKATTAMAEILNNTISANVLEDSYSGPILLSNQAACEVFTQAFLPAFTAQREAIQSDGFRMSMSGMEAFKAFQKKIGGRVLPDFFSIEDDPLLKEFDKVKLLGGYSIDDEGVIPQKIELVKNGYLQTLLSNRTPIKRVTTSNGHDRGGMPLFSNIKINVDKKYKLSDAELKNELIKLCKQRELPYGIFVKKISNDNIVRSQIYGLSQGALEYPRPGSSIIQSVETYKIYQDGREELIRGGNLAGISIAMFKDIIKTGNTDYILNTLQMPPASLNQLMSSVDKLVSVIGQAILLEDGEFQTIESDFRTPPYLSNPINK